MSEPYTSVRYSESFKRQVVAKLEDGTFDSICAAKRHYGINGGETVKRWLKRFGRNDLMAKVVRVEKPGERDRLKALEKKVRDLEHALAQTRMSELLIEGHFEILCEQIGLDPEEEKKKLDVPPLKGRRIMGKTKGESR